MAPKLIDPRLEDTFLLLGFELSIGQLVLKSIVLSLLYLLEKVKTPVTVRHTLFWFVIICLRPERGLGIKLISLLVVLGSLLPFLIGRSCRPLKTLNKRALIRLKFQSSFLGILASFI